MEAKVLTLSSKGQVSLPKDMREAMNIDAGDKLVAYTTGDVIVLKVLKLPSPNDFKESLDEAQAWAASVGYEESDVNSIIKSVRKRNKQ